MSDEEVHIQPGNREPLKVGNKVFKSAFDWELTEKDLEKAARELGETEQKKDACLQKLKKKLSKEQNLKFRQDDLYLLRFLRVRKYDVTKAYKNLKILYEQKKKHPGFFIIPPDLKAVQELNFITCLPYTDEDGRIIIWLNFNRWKPHEKSFEEVSQAVSNVLDIVLMNSKCQINGIIGLIDFGGLTLRQISEVLMNGRLMAVANLCQNGYPWRIKKWIVLNTNWLVQFLFTILRPLLQKKVAERCVLLGSDLNELHKLVNPVLLPKSLQGSLEDEECDMTQRVLDNLSYIRYERSFGFL